MIPLPRDHELLESVAKRLERRAREMDNARAFTDEERTQRRCMTVIYMEISNMLRAEIKRMTNEINEESTPCALVGVVRTCDANRYD